MLQLFCRPSGCAKWSRRIETERGPGDCRNVSRILSPSSPRGERKRLGAGLFGGEGLFLATLRGPGKAYLQTMPMGKLEQKIAQYMPQDGGKGASCGGNVDLGQLFGER